MTMPSQCPVCGRKFHGTAPLQVCSRICAQTQGLGNKPPLRREVRPGNEYRPHTGAHRPGRQCLVLAVALASAAAATLGGAGWAAFEIVRHLL